MRLIDADALKAKLKIGTNTANYSDYCNGYCDARQVDLDAIDSAPTIEAEPVRQEVRKVTNGDRIRQMSDEELAEWLDNVAGCCVCVLYEDKNSRDICKDDCLPYIKKWIKQEVEDNNVLDQ